MALRRKTKDNDASKIAEDVEARCKRGRSRLEQIAPSRDEAHEFYRGNHYAYVDDKNLLQRLATVTSVRGTGKPPHRARQARNFIFDVVLREASAASQRVPSYQVVASTSDPADVGAARLSEKVALFGYNRWSLRQATIDAVIHAVVGGEAFAWPWFDTSIGPFAEDEDGSVGQGDVRVQIFGGNEVYWEPGLRFEKSPWHAVEQARPIEQVKQTPGFIAGDELTPDADSRSVGRAGKRGKLVLVTDYLERPCPKYPKGRWITMANNRKIAEDRDYPTEGEDPVLRKLSFAPDPDNDRDLGLVSQILDPQRTVNDAENKAVEWKNRCLNPQYAVAPGVLKKQRITDEPGKVYEVPQPNENMKVLDVPPVPPELFTMADRAKNDLHDIAGQSDIPPGVESGRAIQALIERNQARSALFVAGLAEFHSNVMHDCLVIVGERYSEPRLVKIKGDFGWESIPDFKGAHLRSQVDVRVFTDSIEPITRQARELRIQNYVQMRALDPKEAMVALETGAYENIVRSFANDEARVGRIIERIKDGSVLDMPMLPTGRLDEMGETELAPGWMPRHSDNLGIFRSTLEDWMKTEEYERLDPQMQEIASMVYGGILKLEAAKAAEAAAAQQAQAEQLGMDAAASPPVKPNPSLPSPNGDGQPTPA